MTPAPGLDPVGRRPVSGAALLNALLTVLAVWLVFGAAPAVAQQQDILRPEQAFRYSVEALADELVLRWQIEPEHYLYRDRMSFESQTPGVRLGQPAMPEGIPYEDDFFGRMVIYRGDAEIRIPLLERPARGGMELDIRSQGCADIGLCYPPQVWTAAVELPAGGGGDGGGGGLLDRLRGAAGGAGFIAADPDQPLPVEEAFRWSLEATDGFNLRVVFDVEPGYYLYRHTMALSASGSDVQLGQAQLPAGTPKWDEEYGDTVVFYDSVTMDVPLTRAGPGAVTVPLVLEYQGCKEGSICYPPQRIDTSVALAAASLDGQPGSGVALPVSEQDRLFTMIQDGSLPAVMLMFAGLGLLLSFTPCCLPMFPILSGILVGQGANLSNMRAFMLALAYVLGMALTYTALGAIVAAAGGQVQAVFQHPWVIVGVSLLFVALALSMFGLYDLQIPTSWQTRLTMLSGRQRSGSLVGAGLMGLISAAVVSTCVTPPLVAALTVIASTGDVTRGALALFALAIGMGIPLLAIGASAGRLMPKAGPWMVSVKAAFGLMMLGLAVWMLDRLWPGTLTLALWAVLLVMAGVFLGAFAPMDREAPPGRKIGKGFGIVAVLYGAALLLGALAGNEDPLRPLRFVSAPAQQGAEQHALFTPIKTVDDLERVLVSARAEGRPVMLDFYADWCVSCKEMERNTFPAPAVQAALSNALLLQADVTAVDADDRALMSRFGIIGPPTILFFLPDGTEASSHRVVGFKPAADFAAHVSALFAARTTA